MLGYRGPGSRILAVYAGAQVRGHACISSNATLPTFRLQGVLTCCEATSNKCYDLGFWLRAALLMYRDAHLSGLNSLQGKDRVIAEALKHFQGIGLLDAYMVKVGRCDSYTSCVWDGSQYYLDGVDNRETRIGHWMSLDGSKPGFSEIQSEDFDAIDDQIMQVSTSHVHEVFRSGVLWC